MIEKNEIFYVVLLILYRAIQVLLYRSVGGSRDRERRLKVPLNGISQLR
jgi:hypothetical protein